MKLIQLNIWYGKLVKNAIKLIERENPDIVCLQELCNSDTGTSDHFDTLDDLQKAFDYPHVFFSPLIDFQALGAKVQFGNAILSRSPFTHTDTVFTNLQYTSDMNYKTTDDINVRNYQHATVETPEGPINIINHHGHLVWGKESNADTDRQIGMIAERVDSLQGPVIVTGDFNLSPHERSINILNGRLNNLCISHNIKTTRNIFAWAEEEVCDFIFVNDAVKVHDFRVYGDIVSDHQALGLEFDV